MLLEETSKHNLIDVTDLLYANHGPRNISLHQLERVVLYWAFMNEIEVVIEV